MDKEKQYAGVLTPGDYVIIAEKPGFMELNECLHATKGETMVQLALQKKELTKLIIHAVDTSTGAGLPGTLLKVPFLVYFIACNCKWKYER